MERILSPEEKIRRAEEIYYRKRQNNNIQTTRLNINSKKDYRLFKKMCIQILVCVGIYSIIYLAQTNESVFLSDVIVQAREMVSYNMDLSIITDNIQKYINSFYTVSENIVNGENEESNEITNESISENTNTTETNAQASETVSEQTDNEEKNTEESTSKTQMEQDAEYIKNNFSMIIPLKGTITSRFGIRNPTTASVPVNHTGIDIAVNEGTVFNATMDGTVELVSSQGDYRKSYKNS